jgi:hypothetical protein
VKKLIGAGIDVNAQTPMGSMPLDIVLTRFYANNANEAALVAIAKLLIDNGAYTNRKELLEKAKTTNNKLYRLFQAYNQKKKLE